MTKEQIRRTLRPLNPIISRPSCDCMRITIDCTPDATEKDIENLEIKLAYLIKMMRKELNK